MPSFIAEELVGVTANCPESLEGRLLFAVPKSESTFDTRVHPRLTETYRGKTVAISFEFA